MIRALKTASTGMTAQKMYIDVIANNLANVNTTGYKRSSLEFQDLLYETLRATSLSEDLQRYTPTQLQVGYGTRPIATQKSFSQGELQHTENALDVAIQGDGFLQIERPDGTYAYTRDGSLKVSADGTLCTSEGYVIEPSIVIPREATNVNIAKNGIISVLVPGDPEPIEVGQLTLATFVNPAGLESLGGNLYRETVASGRPEIYNPGEEKAGTLMQGYLESSNVQVVNEMVEMIMAQRAYEINSKVISTSEQMLSTINNLKR
ncbi:MAG TPA: flagellar basal-body rod protein FlgG [bacterium]|nr:flagellar basal-body rod protein FlgG [bacterium]